MKIRRVRIGLPLVFVVALTLLVGCSGGSGSPGGPHLEKTVLNVAVDPGVDSAGFFIALDNGLFKAQGLAVNFLAAASSQAAIAGQVKGTYDITGGNYVSYIQAQQQDEADLDIFAEGSVVGAGSQGIYTMSGSPVTTLADLKGRTIAVSAPDNILYLLTASVLTEHGISPRSVHFASIPFSEMPAELQSRAVSAAVLQEPFASDDEEALGDVSLADLDQGATTNFPAEGYAVTKQWAAKYPHTLAAFYTALEAGQQIADASRSSVEQAMENMPAPYGVSAQAAAIMALDSYPVSNGPVGSVDETRLQRVADVMTQFLGSPKFDIGTMLMRSG
jgi:NitT/TauT family transport system substrate-binding protein